VTERQVMLAKRRVIRFILNHKSYDVDGNYRRVEFTRDGHVHLCVAGERFDLGTINSWFRVCGRAGA
jgi:hypothetical protein